MSIVKTECGSKCVPYRSYGGYYVVNIDQHEYDCQFNPIIVWVFIDYREEINYNVYDVRFGTFKNPPKFQVLVDRNLNMTIINNTPGLEVTQNKALIEYLRVNVTLTEKLNIPGGNIPGDFYLITLSARDCAGYYGVKTAQIYFSRKNDFTFGSGTTNSKTSLEQRAINLEINNIIPRINIQGQSNILGLDVGNVLFTIYDEFTYYNNQKIPDDNCKHRETLDVKETKFRECCPNVNMVSVVRGEGDTLRGKIQYLIDMNVIENTNIYEFMPLITLYGMTKYILAKLLWGEFNINFLLGKYNDKFLKRLSTSRFCSFIEYFNTYDYNKYFLYDIHSIKTTQ